nr:amidohydrolase family protein [Clostridia bacterium]
MKYARVHASAVVDKSMYDYSFTFGNMRGLETQKNPRLFGVAGVPTTVRIECGEGYLKQLYNDGFRIFTTCPTAFNESFSAGDMTYLANFLIDHDLPLLMTCTQVTFDALDAVMTAHPELKIILTDTSWGTNRKLFGLLERHRNLHFDISSNQANEILEITKKHFGIERALFGADWPKKSMPAIKSLIEYADLSEADKDMVAYGNACRLLHVDPMSLELYDDAECEWDDIAKECDAGLPLSVPVTDSHTHMAPAEDMTVTGFPMLNSDCDNIVKKMDRMGVDRIITAPWHGIANDGRAGNRDTLYAATKYPGRFLGFSTCNIHYEADLKGQVDPHDTAYEAGFENYSWKTMHTEHPDVFVGIKPYWPYQRFDLAHPNTAEWYEYANAHNLLMLVHTGNDAVVDRVAELSLKYPNISFILAHTGISYAVARKNLSVAKIRDNVYLELTYTSTTRDIVEFLVSEVGAEKVLYGSDLPMRDPSPQLGWVAYTKLTTEQKKLILGGNIDRLLKRRV